MNTLRLAFAAPLILLANLLPGAAQSHTHLLKSEPAQRSELTVAPKQALLAFAAPVRLTAVNLQSEADKKSQPLKPLPATSVTEAKLDLPALTPGHYTINWRAAGEDGHVMSGTIFFTLKK